MSSTPTSDMEAIVLHAVGDLRYEKVAVPAAGPGEVRVRIGFCGVCGSDIPRCFSKGTYSFPTICGHEFAGTVESCGEGVTQFRPGDRVAVFPLLWREDHAACEQGKYAQSDGYDYLGSRSDGAFSEYVVAPERNLIRVPDNVSLEEAAMTEPAAVALHAVRRAKVRLGDTVAVFGLGPIGLMVAQWLKASGAGPIILFDIQPEKLEIARQLGIKGLSNWRELAALQIEAELVQMNEVAMEKHKFKAGMRVRFIGGPTVYGHAYEVGSEFLVSTVKADGRIYLKQTNGASAYASQLEPVT